VVCFHQFKSLLVEDEEANEGKFGVQPDHLPTPAFSIPWLVSVTYSSCKFDSCLLPGPSRLVIHPYWHFIWALKQAILPTFFRLPYQFFSILLYFS
jgi:hypothetical protein